MTPDAIAAALERILPHVTTPIQYAGHEWNAVVPAGDAVACRVALAFPDAYAVGMSHHGLRILYELLNDLDGVVAERCFAPLPDMEARLRAEGIPLHTLESFTPLSACDLVGFSLQYELAAANLLTMLDLGGIPLLARDRTAAHPLILAGGSGGFNPEPLSDFLDLVLVGEGEEALPELVAAWRAADARALPREALLRRLVAACPGWYAPALYDEQDGVRTPRVDEAPATVRRRLVADLDAAPHPVRPVVPTAETAHERVTVEIMRGCPNGCRFCQAGMIHRPRRVRSVETVCRLAHEGLANTGYDEIGLLSLSTGDHPDFGALVTALDDAFAPQRVSLSLPSLRVDAALRGIPSRVRSVRKGGFTSAPEAGAERLRAVINKAVSDADLLAGAEAAFQAGWRTVKLYFMIGLPTETDEDVDAIAALANRVAALRRGKKGGRAVTLSVSNFVPKPWTPFQWHGMDAPDVLRQKQQRIADAVDSRRIAFHGHDVETSILEGALARGDRRLGAVVLAAWRAGARLCAWTEHFRPDLWRAAFADAGRDPAAEACRARTPGGPLPWGHLDGGVAEAFLLREREKALAAERTAPCAPGRCPGCGVPQCPDRTAPPAGMP